MIIIIIIIIIVIIISIIIIAIINRISARVSEFLHACRTETRRTCDEARRLDANLSGVVEIDSENGICSMV